ncbi:MAG: hypothetical protein MUP70_14110, partial [Candidatus Aminicenantes bacterium]|nr:hypothetical protein [Candidatus Aminicenantes bacterium]
GPQSTITIEGEVKENVINFGGTIIVDGDVGELVLGIGSTIRMTGRAAVDGDVVCIGGILSKEDGTSIKGDTIYFEMKDEEGVGRFFNKGLGGMFGLSLIPFFLIIKLISLFIWFMVSVILAAVLPSQITFASDQIKKNFWPITGTGLISILFFSLLILVTALMSLILIGIPLLIALVIIGFVIKVFGRVILYHYLGESLARIMGNKNATPILSVILGCLLVSVITLIPVIGALASLVLSIIGWGVVIRTKFGTRRNWFSRSI